MLESPEDKDLQPATEGVVRFVFVGSPLLDISAKCDQTTLDIYELKPDDCVRAKDEHDSLFRQLFQSPDSRLSAGGSAQNAACIAKWILRDQGEVAFTGCTGHDDFEAWMRNKLISEGVVPLYVEDPVNSTGVCACLLNSEEKRSMIAKLGAGALYSTPHLDVETVRIHLMKAHCIFVEGYFLVHSPLVVHALSDINSPGKVFSLSLSAEYVCRSHAHELLKVLPKVDVLFGNEAEMKAFACAALGAKPQITVYEAVMMMRQLPRAENSSSRIVVVTQGSNPVILDDGSSNKLLTFDVPKDIPVVDSVGCGDALAGAFLASYILTENIEIAVQTGIRAAAQILQVAGCDMPPHNDN